MQPAQWIVVLGITVAVFGLRKFVRHRLLQNRTEFFPTNSKVQSGWEWIGGLIVALWCGSMIAIGKAMRNGDFSQFQLVLGIAVVALFGLAVVWWKYRALKLADELIQRIEVEALALGLGFFMVGSIAADELRRVGIGFDTRDWFPGMGFMLLTLVSNGIGRVVVYFRYR